MSVINKLLTILSKSERIRLVILFITILIMALFQVLGIASILPFMQLVSDPEALNNNEVLQWIQNTFGLTSTRSMLIATGFGVLVSIVVGNAFSAFTIWLQHKYAWEIAHNISTSLLRNYLAKPYKFFLNNNTSILLNKALVEVVRFTKEVLIQIIEFCARFFTVLVIFALLLWVDPKLALVASSVLGVAYIIIYQSTRRYLAQLGKRRTTENESLFKNLNEALVGSKTIRIYGAKNYFYKRFEEASLRLINIHPRVRLISDSPRYLIEMLAFGGILAVTLYLISTGDNIKAVLPVLSLYVLAGYRLLPALQKSFAAAANLKHSYSSLDHIHEDLNNKFTAAAKNYKQDTELLPFSNEISFEKVGFAYDDTQVFERIDLKIKKGSTIAFVGPTGSGKSTLIDLMVGLLQPTKGDIKIDGTRLVEDNTGSWNKQIGYVPQEVFLFDDTIRRNIAIGVPDEEIDDVRVEAAAKMASIHQFISEDLSDGYDNHVGDRGVRLSGGQRQRIGLARAFYRNPGLIILDEATNALDNITESSIIESIRHSKKDVTVIMVSHRLSTVKHADCIYVLKDGELIDEGSYDQLLSNNQIFRDLAQISN